MREQVKAILKPVQPKKYMKEKLVLSVFVDISRETLKRWVEDGLISKYVIGGNVLYSLEEIDQVIQEHRIGVN